MSQITTHVLDTSLGKPAAGVSATLMRLADDAPAEAVGSGTTNADGRIGDLLPEGELTRGTYRLVFETAPYFAASQRESFYPHIEIAFRVEDPSEHFHVPVLLSPFGYSTYRGS